MVVLWGATVVGGYLGLLLGEYRLTTLASVLIPNEWADVDFVRNTISPRLAQVHDFLGFPLPRPSAPFTFTNEWGANLAALFPIVIAAWPGLDRRPRRIVGFLAVASVVPMVVSANRGLWVTLIGTAVYVSVRLAQRRDPRAARRLVAMVVALVALVALTPLGSVVSGRFESDHSNRSRLTIYTQATDAAADSPLLGYGSPRSNPLDPDLPPVGTHGTFWLVLFSHGIPGAVLFVGAMWSLVWRTARPRDTRLLWVHGTVVAGLVMLPFYDLLPVPIFTVMAAAAVVLRDGSLERAT
jgi:O-antigen ligase